tara:strand:+ start:318 stop:539 length:222 start_codon:yes stop_codon:yes gene_type:complete
MIDIEHITGVFTDNQSANRAITRIRAQALWDEYAHLREVFLTPETRDAMLNRLACLRAVLQTLDEMGIEYNKQ